MIVRVLCTSHRPARKCRLRSDAPALEHSTSALKYPLLPLKYPPVRDTHTTPRLDDVHTRVHVCMRGVWTGVCGGGVGGTTTFTVALNVNSTRSARHISLRLVIVGVLTFQRWVDCPRGH